MPYATQLDMTDRYGESELIEQTNLDGTGAIDADTVARALEDASALIDGYLSSRYPLPIATPPALLITLCCDLARYALFVDAAPGIVEKRRDQAVSTLRDIAAGRIALNVGQPGAGVPAPSGLAVVVQSGRKVFGGGLR